ncbi:hypothetical protein ACSNKK_00590 [Proteus mirabilis]|uniref:hypothetical protein n=1 Tax=Proteus mirabilis TaxID=584 RepID=UPI003F1A2FD0
MNFEIYAGKVSIEPDTTNKVMVKLKDTYLDGSVSASDIVNEYPVNELLDEIDNDDIISHLECQGYTVTKD